MTPYALAALVACSVAALADPGDAPPREGAAAAQGAGAAGPEERWAVRFQSTIATQAHPSFAAPYTGRNSLRPGAESATSIVTDLAGGARLWDGAEGHVQAELSGGRGLSSTLGVAAFPSGEVYRVGNPTPTIFVARAFLRQVVGLGGGRDRVAPELNQLAGAADRDRLTITAGKVSVPDFVDAVPVSNDPHTRFMSWGLFASAAYDYPADTRGYTWGVAADLTLGRASLRSGLFLEPREANQLALEWDVGRARGLVAEVEVRHTLGGRAGATRVLAFLNDAHMGSYREALARSPARPDVTATRAFGRTKAGVAASAEQDLGGGLSAFARASWSDGANETWAFTEVDRSAAVGAVQSGARWGRPGDEAGAAVVVSGLSSLHRAYLAAGGYGFLLGDGALRYGLEVLGEAYYRVALTREISVGVNYQPIFDPAFNRDRGPVHVFTGRLHVAL